MKCGHLFNGISGFGLAASWMGWENVMHCEIDPFCNKVMNYHFPNSIQHEDIRTTDFSIYRGKLDLLTGGFPCQPYSTSGKRLGKEDERHLWPEMLRAIREIQPGWIVGENVRGLTNWNGGLVFDEVQADLEAEGYEVLPFLLPAAGVNAPHRRDRIWLIAYSGRFIGKGRKNIGSVESEYNRKDGKGATTDATGGGGGQDNRVRKSKLLDQGFSIPDWANFPTQSPVCNRNDGLSLGLARISVPGKRRRRLLSPVESYERWRKESIKTSGNAIAPQIAFQIFKAIQAYAQPPLTPNP